MLGLSYGIEERDMWSEKMSNVFRMPTRLYDCFIPPQLSPPIAKTAPNGTSCQGIQGHCYETPYESFRICLGAKAGNISGRQYVTLQEHLVDRPPLSTHLKIDTEGTEWAILEQFLASPEDQDKVRTLEMEVHFSYQHEGDDPAHRGVRLGVALCLSIRGFSLWAAFALLFLRHPFLPFVVASLWSSLVVQLDVVRDRAMFWHRAHLCPSSTSSFALL